MWSSYPILRPTIAALLGMMGANFLLSRIHFSIYIPLILLAVAVGATAWIYRRHTSLSNQSPAFGIGAMTAFFLLGATMIHWRFLSVEADAVGAKKMRVGVVATTPVEKTKWWTMTFHELNGAKTMLYVAKRDSTDSQMPDIQKGDTIWALSYFDMPSSPYLRKIKQREMDEWKAKKEERKRNKKKDQGEQTQDLSKDTVATDSDGERQKQFDGYADYLFYNGISSSVYVSEGAWGYKMADMPAVGYGASRHDEDKAVAELMRRQYEEAGMSEEGLAIVNAMTTGDKSVISAETKEHFSQAGISHVLALSGFHLTVIVSLLDVLLMRSLFKRRWKRLTALIIIPFIWAFAAIAGFPPSLVRATVMCSVFQLALVVGHGQQLKNAAAIAGFFMLLANPLLIMNVGFQLSFLSIIGIAVMGAPLCTWIGQKTGRWAVILDIIAISLTCTLFTFPVVAYHFGQIPLYSIISNLAVSLIATLIMWGAVLWWIFVWCQPVLSFLTKVLDYLAQAMVWVADKVAAMPMSTIVYKPNILEVAVLYAITAFLIAFVYKKERKLVWISALLLACLPAVHYI